ncbi:MAG: beta-phosphoglucomutase [Kiritimatiellaceae bacterium]|nr:beta-phosphoglucomutase [Kiritimatiellaceae bacterium]
MLKGVIFDLDGVIVDTAKYHYLAWARLARELGFEFTETDNERLKGVSRMQSLEFLLDTGKVSVPEEKKEGLAQKKNDWYVDYIKQLREDEILPGAKKFLLELRANGILVSLGSASKNSPLILERLKIVELFDAVVDGRDTTRGKPDPQVFQIGAQKLGLACDECVVFEDADAGIVAAHAAGMKAVGIGTAANLPDADYLIADLSEMNLDLLKKIYGKG